MKSLDLSPISLVPFPYRIDTETKFKEWQASISRPQSITCFGQIKKDSREATHFEIIVRRSCLLGDVDSIDKARRSAIEGAAADIHTALMREGGSVVWRTDLEVVEREAPVWLAVDHSGSETDFVTDRRGYTDNRFGLICARIRFFVWSVVCDRDQYENSVT